MCFYSAERSYDHNDQTEAGQKAHQTTDASRTFELPNDRIRVSRRAFVHPVGQPLRRGLPLLGLIRRVRLRRDVVRQRQRQQQIARRR